MRPKLTPELHFIQFGYSDAIFVGGDVPVSYTHLDVYKRQVLCSDNSTEALFIFECSINEGIISVGNFLDVFIRQFAQLPRNHSAEDVYKRQSPLRDSNNA